MEKATGTPQAQDGGGLYDTVHGSEEEDSLLRFSGLTE